MPKISAIVPVYKVEEYLSRCLNSILSQNISDMEIILVDDGSPDNCGVICDSYTEQNNNINVIHKANGGLSDARNTGMMQARGEYIFFLDSDDYLEENALLELLALADRTRCDIVVANFYYTYYDHEKLFSDDTNQKIIMSTYEGLKALVSGKIQNFAWGKLYRTDLVKKHPFPVGKLFEDIYWAHFIFAEARKIAVTGNPAVHYVQREGSISAEFKFSNLDILDGYSNRYRFLMDQYPELCADLAPIMIKATLQMAWIIVTRMKKTERKRSFKRLQVFVTEHLTFLTGAQLCTATEKIQLYNCLHGAARYFLFECFRRALSM